MVDKLTSQMKIGSLEMEVWELGVKHYFKKCSLPTCVKGKAKSLCGRFLLDLLT